MSYSMMGLNNYSRLFTSLTNTSGASSLTNNLFGGAVASLYTTRLSEALKSTMSVNLSPLSSTSYNLKTSSQNLIATNKNSAFNAKTVSSSSSNIAASVQNGAKNQTYKIKVTQTAQAQVNISSALSSDEKSSVSEGTHSIKINSGDKSSTVSFNVTEGKTNKEVLSDIASAINNSKSGVTAKVVNDQEKKTSYLEISSNQTGSKSSFELSDLSGNSASAMGFDQVSSVSKDAIYSVDGTELNSSSNNISLDNGKVNLTLKDKTEEEVTVTIKNDNKSIEEELKDYAEDFNKSLEQSSSSGSPIAERLSKELRSVVTSKQGSLSSIGLNVSSNGSIQVDEEKLKLALEQEPDKVKKLVGGFEGIAAKTKNLSERLLTVSAVDSNSNNFYNSLNSFQNYLKNASKSTFMKNQASGLFLDMLL